MATATESPSYAAVKAMRLACEAEVAVRNHSFGNDERLRLQAEAVAAKTNMMAALSRVGIDTDIIWRAML